MRYGKGKIPRLVGRGWHVFRNDVCPHFQIVNGQRAKTLDKVQRVTKYGNARYRELVSWINTGRSGTFGRLFHVVGDGPRLSRESRGALWVEMEMPDGQLLQVINTHLSIYPRDQFLQTQALLSDGWVDAAWDRGPVILLGDFNARPASSSYQLMASRLVDVFGTFSATYKRNGIRTRHREFTWPSGKPLVRIDHIFTSIDDFEVLAANTIGSVKANLASDHLPFVAHLRTKGVESEPPAVRSRTSRTAAGR